MRGYIDGVDFINLPAEKYWSFPSTYKGDKAAEIKQMIFSGAYCGARKIDGCHYRFIKDEDGNMILQGRTESVNGGYLDKIEWVPQLKEFFEGLPNGTCLLGELYFPNDEGSKRVTTIMGCLKDKAIARQEAGQKLHYYIFDVWAWDGKSCLNMDMNDRTDILVTGWRAIGEGYQEWAEYFQGQELWDKLQEVLAEGGEGVVITQNRSYPEPGKRTSRKTLKIKKELEHEFDAFLTGRFKPATRPYKGSEIQTWQYWEDLRSGKKMNGTFYPDYQSGAPIEPVTKAYFYGWASAVEIGLINPLTKSIDSIGWISGITDEVKEKITQPDNEFIHAVVKVTAMEIDNVSGALRHGKITEFRKDKGWLECTLDQLKELQ